MFDSLDIVNMETFIQLAKRGSRINGTEITELYNKVFKRNLRPTNCSSCINQRYKELKTAYDNFQKLLREQEEKAKALEVLDEIMTPTQEEIVENNPKKGRPKKKE